MKKVIIIVIILLLGTVLFWFIYKKFENDALNNAVINTNINNETEDNVMKLNINGK